MTSQILCEFYSIVTNSRRVARVTKPTDALNIISLRQNPVSGAGIFDLQIVATMEANDIRTIYTFDGGFERFPDLTVIEP